MSSSLYFGDFYQIGLVIEKKSDNPKSPDFIHSFFDQAFNKQRYFYQHVDPQAEKSAISRAFFHNHTEQSFVVFTGENYDYTTAFPNDIENQSSVQSFKDLVPSMIGKDYSKKKLTYILPLSYLTNDHQYRIHVVLFAQLRPSHHAGVNCMKNPFYLVPCMPVKVIDQSKINTDFMASLQMMYYGRQKQGRLFSLENVYVQMKGSDRNQQQAVEEMQRARVVMKMHAHPF